jgi:hypothetical protein
MPGKGEIGIQSDFAWKRSKGLFKVLIVVYNE